MRLIIAVDQTPIDTPLAELGNGLDGQVDQTL